MLLQNGKYYRLDSGEIAQALYMPFRAGFALHDANDKEVVASHPEKDHLAGCVQVGVQEFIASKETVSPRRPRKKVISTSRLKKEVSGGAQAEE